MNAIRRLLALGHVAGATTTHERLPSLCLALALAAVFCPVVIILGLKNGAVENLRQALLRDPSNLELRPRSTVDVDASLLSRIRALRGVGFAVPKTRSLGLAEVQFQVGEKVAEIDLVPTAAGDPVLERHGAGQPGPMQAVLSFVAARALGLDGDGPATIVMSVGRYDADGRREEKTLPIEVVRVLPLAATTLRAAYVSLDLLEAVEQFRENLAVPWLQWSGGDSVAADPVFDGFVVWGEEVLAPALASRVAVASNFLEQRTIDQADPDRELAAFAARHGHVKLFYNPNNPQPIERVQRAKALLAEGNVAGVLPWSNPRELTVVDSLERRFPVVFHTSLSEDSAGIVQGMAPLAMTLPASAVMAPPTRIEVASRVGRLEFPMEVTGRAGLPANDGPNILHGTPWLTGVLRHLDFRTLQWEPEGKRFLLGRRNFSGLRLYARSLEDVRPLSEKLRNEGIECDSAADRVERVLELERNLGSLFLLVSAFSLTGGGAALALSLYGTIERRRRDYGMLRTLGASKLLLGFLPMVEAVVLSGAGFLIAMMLFHACATLINSVLVPQDEGAGPFCQLPLQMQATVGAVILGLALLCSSVAALRVLSISPSDAIRHA
jgi:putative ABC transport system permease protein